MTPKGQTSKLVLLYLVHICRKFLKVRTRGRNFEESESYLCGLRFPMRHNLMMYRFRFPGHPPTGKRPKETHGTGVYEFPDLRSNYNTKNKRKQTDIPYQDGRNLSTFAWFSLLRQETKTIEQRRKRTFSRRILDGIARAIESL